jgi:type III secretion protein U
MSEEKTEQPTPKKIRDAREKGQVAQSKDITLATAISVMMTYIIFSNGYLTHEYAECYQLIIRQIQINDLSFSAIIQIIEQISNIVAYLVLPIFIAATVSVFMNIAQLKGIVLSKEFLKLDFNKFNPVNNAKSIFSKKTVLKFFKQNIEISIMLFVVWLYIQLHIENMLKLSYAYYLSDIMRYISGFFIKVFLILISIYVIAAIIDYMIEARSLTKQLMMSHKEIEDEYKNTEGNPEIKARRREFHHELLEDDSAFNMVNHSSFLIANPTHIVILVLYNPSKWPLPIVLAKATDRHALRLIKIAEKLNVLVVRDKPLARQIFDECAAGTFVPVHLMRPIAKIIAENMDKLTSIAEQLRKMPKISPQLAKETTPYHKPSVYNYSTRLYSR